MNDTLLPWQEAAWQRLAGYQSLDRVPQALILTGDEQSNLERLARLFGQSLLCLTPRHGGFACGRCASCLLEVQHNHPDWHWLTPEPGKTLLAIDQLRALMSGLYLKPRHGRYRVLTLAPADRLGISAANAFLKYLEEPGARTIILLPSEAPARLPVTVRSRCQTLNCPGPARSEALDWLRRQGVEDAGEALLAMAGGHPVRALVYAGKDHGARHQDCFRHWCDIACGKRRAVDVALLWTQPPEALSDALNWLLLWGDDLIRYRMGVPAGYLRQPRLKAALQGLPEPLQLKMLFSWRDQVLSAVRARSASLNAHLLLEDLLLAWQHLFHQ